MLLSKLKVSRDTPRGIIRKATVTDLACLDALRKGLQYLKHLRSLFLTIVIREGYMSRPMFTEMRGSAIWPVQLIQVDIICLQTF